MIKSLINLVKVVFFSFVIYMFLASPQVIINSVNYSMDIFMKNLVPTLFPFFVLVDFLMNYGYVDEVKKFFKFKYGHIILLSMVSGLPSNAKYIKTFLDKKMISMRDAEIMLSATFFPNPMFVISSVGLLMMGSLKLGVMALISVYTSNLLMYLIYYKKLGTGSESFSSERLSFSKLLSNSIKNNASTLLVILGTIMFFMTILNVITHYFNINNEILAFISGILEMTSGVKNMSTTIFSTQVKYLFICLILSFSGMSVLMQALSILSDYKINVKFILKNKLIIMLLNFLINYFYIIFFV